jgi:hypothetical protein
LYYEQILAGLQRAVGLMTHPRAGLMTRKTHKGVGVVGNPLVARRMVEYGGVLFSAKTGAL